MTSNALKSKILSLPNVNGGEIDGVRLSITNIAAKTGATLNTTRGVVNQLIDEGVLMYERNPNKRKLSFKYDIEYLVFR